MAKEKHFFLDNDAFFVKGERFSYKDVTETEFYYVQTQKRLNLGASGIDHNVEIKLFLNSRSKPIKIKTGPQYITLHGLSFGKESTESVISKFNEISSRTFNQRVEKYLQSLDQYGYFFYDGKKIFLNGDVVSEKWKANFYQDKPWLKSPFVVFYEKRPGRLLRSSIRYEIQTLRDSDVFFALMNRFYKMSW